MNKRSYGQHCSLAYALDIIGDRWTLLMIRELLIGESRYKDLLSALQGIGTNLLAKRLQELIEVGVVEKDSEQPSGRNAAYRLTEFGLGLRPVVFELIRWGYRLPPFDDVMEGPTSNSRWDLLAVEALRRHAPPKKFNACCNFSVGEALQFHLRCKNGVAEVLPAHAEDADATISGDPQDHRAVVLGELSIAVAIKQKRLTVRGDRAKAMRMMALFQE